MKKFTLFMGVCCLLIAFTPVTVTFAQDTPQVKEITPSDVKYVTTGDILLTLIEPKLNKIVSDQYGEPLPVQPVKIVSAGRVVDPALHKNAGEDTSWFQVEINILVGDLHKKVHLDEVILKIDAPNIEATEHHFMSDDIKNIDVELLKYTKGK
ncbi:hypothetical protein JOD43_002467 [Pullulanibacillus pueri]|uniref:DUF3888 domain-containing protein n=1 Tax=Pullulanibacillus pueri TaxID=1437324 RepID=A0A8J3ELG5_9BACL|nr:DUF3888 domain-containing protein [Pullulanibacillus pueri]MBM7682292.1 hypothetical protein [Pullulanibacillus pueri]GGH80918.1 hypothetical protein GCM10007096_18040 [Pullulanibacillus pueri]